VCPNPNSTLHIHTHTHSFTHHQDERVVGDVGDQDEQGQTETEAGTVEGVGYANDAAANDRVDIVERCLW